MNSHIGRMVSGETAVTSMVNMPCSGINQWMASIGCLMLLLCLPVSVLAQQEAFQEKMREVASENPEFVEALARHSRIVEHYRAETGRGED